jgi:uncharacterized protein
MSPRHILKRYVGSRESLSESRAAGRLGKRLHNADIWHPGRRSVAGGVSLGFFLAFIPLPVQMLIAAPLALLFRVNLPVALIAVWITNPITIAPLFIFAFKIGSWISGRDSENSPLTFEPSFDAIATTFGEIWLPLWIGCLVCGSAAAIVGNVAVRLLWRANLFYRRRQRRKKKLNPQ